MSDGKVQELNTMNPAAYHAQLGTMLQQTLLEINCEVNYLAIATTTSKIKTVQPLMFDIAGVPYNLAASDNFWTLDATCNADQNNFIAVVLYISTAGAASFAVSNSSGAHGYSTAALALANLPAIDQTKAIAGIALISNGAGAFVGGTTALTGIVTFSGGGNNSLNMLPV